MRLQPRMLRYDGIHKETTRKAKERSNWGFSKRLGRGLRERATTTKTTWHWMRRVARAEGGNPGNRWAERLSKSLSGLAQTCGGAVRRLQRRLSIPEGIAAGQVVSHQLAVIMAADGRGSLIRGGGSAVEGPLGEGCHLANGRAYRVWP